MEPLTLFASTVGLISACHLISQTAHRFGKGMYDSGNKEGKRQDWYCFFQPSDLTGKQGTEHTQQSEISDDQRLEQRRRQQAHRPRLHV